MVPQIVDRDSGNLYQYILHSLVLIFDPKGGGGGGVGGRGGGEGFSDKNNSLSFHF